MERLIADAAALSDTVDEQSLSFDNIVQAIHVVQTEMGITGTTAKEASGTISGSFGSMKAAASNFATSLVSDNGDVDGSFETLKETAGVFFDNLKPKILAFLKAISPVATVVAGITDAFIAFKIAAAISSLLGTLIKSWQAYKAANEGATIAQWLLNAAMNANPIVLIVTLIAGLVGAIITLWHTNDDFKEGLIKAWDAIKNAAVVVWESIVKFFTEDIPNAFKAVINFVKDNWQALLLFITNPIAGALKLLYDLNPKFKEWVDNLFGKIKDWFGGMKDIGKNIVNGLLNGIKGAWSKLTKWFTDAWDSLVGGVKDLLGIHSPSRTFAEIGKNMALGVGDGWDDEFGDVEKDINGSMSFDDATFGVSSYGSSGASGGGLFGGTSFGTVNINIDGANVQDDAALADMVAERLQRMTERRGAVFA